nr:hypothetical protein Iba_chr12cCG0660 [Ipomoea batatas]
MGNEMGPRRDSDLLLISTETALVQTPKLILQSSNSISRTQKQVMESYTNTLKLQHSFQSPQPLRCHLHNPLSAHSLFLSFNGPRGILLKTFASNTAYCLLISTIAFSAIGSILSSYFS